MTVPKRSVLIVVVIAVTAVAIGATAWVTRSPAAPSAAGGAAGPGPVIAMVDDDPIYLADARARVQGLTSVHGGSVQEALGANWQDRLLQSLVDDRIIVSQAAALGVTVTDGDVQQHVDKIAEMFQTDQGFQDWLVKNRMTEADLFQRVKLQTLGSLVYLKVTDDSVPSAADVRAYFLKHRQDYVGVDGKLSPFIAVKDQIATDLEKTARDGAYGAWLKDQRVKVHVVVVDPTWWKEIGA